MRSRYKQNSKEESASLSHAAKEISNDRNNITALNIDGKVVTDQEHIHSTVTSYFNALFNGFHNTDLENTGIQFSPDYTHLQEFLCGVGSLDAEESNNL